MNVVRARRSETGGFDHWHHHRIAHGTTGPNNVKFADLFVFEATYKVLLQNMNSEAVSN